MRCRRAGTEPTSSQVRLEKAHSVRDKSRLPLEFKRAGPESFLFGELYLPTLPTDGTSACVSIPRNPTTSAGLGKRLVNLRQHHDDPLISETLPAGTRHRRLQFAV